MKKRKFKISDIIFVVFIALLLIPQTRTPIQVALNKLKVAVWSPSVEDEGKVTFLSYWATWCPPCIAELPGIQELYSDYGDKVDFVLLSQEETDKVQRFITKKGYDVPVYIPQMQAPEILQSNSLPTNYIIDAKGNIIIKETGAADWNSNKVRILLDGLLSK